MRWIAVTALLIAGTVTGAGATQNPEFDLSYDDLLVQFGEWDGCEGWLGANRMEILRVSRRATPLPAGGVRPEDAAARGRARGALLKALGSKDVLVASEAALALGRAGDPQDIPTLARIVREAKADRRMLRWAAIGLGELPTGDAEQAAEARDALLRAVDASWCRRDESAAFWSFCAYALAMRDDKAAVPQLIELRQKMAPTPRTRMATHGEVVGAVCYALAALAGDLALPELSSQLDSPGPIDRDIGDARWSAAVALRLVGGEHALALLRKNAEDPREPFRCMAVQALGVTGVPMDDATVALLTKTLSEDRDLATRQMAAIALGRGGPAQAATTLAKAFGAAGQAERRFLAIALGLRLRTAPDAKLADLLAKELDGSSSPDERAALTVACGLANVQAARASIVGRIPKNRQGVATASGCFALGLLGAGPKERTLLHEAIDQSVDPRARLEAALTLGLLRDRTVVDRLREILASRNPDRDRGAAAMCLGHVGDDADIDFLVARLADRGTSDSLRACLLRGLGRLLDRNEGRRLARIVANGRWKWQAETVDPLADLRGLVE